jgi:hypothetical protein
MTTRSNLYVDQGVDFAVVLDLFDADGQDFNIINQTFKCEVRKVFSSTKAFDAIVSINTDNADLNDLTLTIPGEATRNKEPGKYQYDILMFDGTQTTKLLEGLIFLLPTITSSE